MSISKEEVLNSDDSVAMAKYCMNVEDDPEVWKKLAMMRGIAFYGQSLYCRYVKDREEMWRAMLHSDPDDSLSACMIYLIEVKVRPEILDHMKKATDLIDQLSYSC